MLYFFSYGWEQVLIQRILIGFEGILENVLLHHQWKRWIITPNYAKNLKFYVINFKSYNSTCRKKYNINQKQIKEEKKIAVKNLKKLTKSASAGSLFSAHHTAALRLKTDKTGFAVAVPHAALAVLLAVQGHTGSNS